MTYSDPSLYLRVYSSVSGSGRGRELYITDITEQDQGDYTCRARYGNQEVTASFKLSVFSESGTGWVGLVRYSWGTYSLKNETLPKTTTFVNFA